jgi:predicted RNase H-like nuclease (RuvC/YqgF family)
MSDSDNNSPVPASAAKQMVEAEAQSDESKTGDIGRVLGHVAMAIDASPQGIFSRLTRLSSDNERLAQDNARLKSANAQLQRDLQESMQRELTLGRRNLELATYEVFFRENATKVPQMRRKIEAQEAKIAKQDLQIMEQSHRIERLEKDNVRLRQDNSALVAKNKKLGARVSRLEKQFTLMHNHDAARQKEFDAAQAQLASMSGNLAIGQMISRLETHIQSDIMSNRRERDIASIRLICSGRLELNSGEKTAWSGLLKQCGIDADTDAVFIEAAVEAIKDARNKIAHPKQDVSRQCVTRSQMDKIISEVVVGSSHQEFASKLLHALCILKKDETDVLS